MPNSDATVLVCTHDLDEAEALCTRVLMLDGGRVVADGTAAELRAHYGDSAEATLEDVFLRLTGRSFGDDSDDDDDGVPVGGGTALSAS